MQVSTKKLRNQSARTTPYLSKYPGIVLNTSFESLERTELEPTRELLILGGRISK